MVVEIDIIRRILRGEIDTFRYFIDTYKDMAFSLVMGMIQDESIAEDVVQTAFINAFRNLKKFKRRSKFSTWFYTIVLNEARIQLRKNKSNVLSLEDYHFHDTALYIENPAFLNLHRSDQKRIINNVLSKLSSVENLLMRLYYQNENSINEIQKITGFTISKIKTGLHRARRNFNRKLTKEFKGEIGTLSSYGD
jgi:RNA polymerase sigma-70 factor (ECF subfamily)